MREETSHHEQTHNIQKVFAQHVSTLKDVFEEMRNSFLEHIDELLVLDTHDVMDSAVMGGIRQAELTGQEQ